MSTVSESLAPLEVLVGACQATAAAPHGHLLEIGWARAGTTTARAHTRLIALPHGEHIPPAVMRLTGISERMSQDGVEAHVAWRELSNDAATLARQPAPTVIHFARLTLPGASYQISHAAACVPSPDTSVAGSARCVVVPIT